MRFGIFYEHQLPRPWDDTSEHQLIQDALDQCELADSLGFDYVWEVEHHFLEEYSHSSAPEVFLSAVSQRTKRMRLGHGIVLTAPQFNHPARTAERLAMLDLVSGGRVEFGSGESSSEAELGGFGVPPDRKRDAWLEGLETAIRCMTETPFTGVDGEFVQMPPRNVVPKPVQSPHPPLWVACSRHDTILLAAEKGMGALSFAFIDPEEARGWVEDYERTLTDRCVPVGEAVNPQIACVSPMMCHEDEQTALSMGLEGGNFFGYSLGHFYVFGDHKPGETDVWAEFEQRRHLHGYDPAVALAAESEVLGAKISQGDNSGLRGAIGTPEQIRQFLRRYEEAGVDQVIFIMQAGKNRHADIMSSIELFGKEVLPEFADRDVELRAKKMERLGPAMEAAMGRKVRNAPSLPEGYTMTAIPKQMASLAEMPVDDEALEAFADQRAVGKRNADLGILG